MKVDAVRGCDQIMDYVLNQTQVDLVCLCIHSESPVHTLVFDKLVFEIQPNRPNRIF